MKSRKPTYDHITREATEPSARWSRKDQLLFQCFNPRGVLARKLAANDRISAAVAAGKLKNGAILAYGTFNHYYDDQLLALVSRRKAPSEIELYLAVSGLRKACEVAEAEAAKVGF